ELLLAAGSDAGGGPSAEAAEGGFWSGAIAPVQDDALPASQEASRASDTAAQLALVGERLALVRPAGSDADSVSRRRQRRLLDAVRRGLASPWLARSSGAPVRLPLTGLSSQTALPLCVDAFMRAVTGTLARPGNGLEPRLAFFSGDISYVEPTVLTDRGLPRGWTLATASENRAVFTPNQSHSSVRVGPDGEMEPGALWPSAVTGEVPWGDEGGSLAWNVVTSTVLFRAHSGAEPVLESVPFQPALVPLEANGSAIWSHRTGGIWEWLPGRSGRLIIDAPSAGGLRVDRGDIVLSPVDRDDLGRALRRRLHYEWRYDASTRALRRTPTGPDGQCARAARRGAWTARSFPFSDLVRLDRDDGQSILLACHTPLGVAWAGTSLVVTTGDGIVLLFGRLVDHLEAFLAGSRLAE
ncbi:MAG: hypothetical protein ACHQO8_10000, partial [Vicinamibacterales bacterium]